MSAHSATVNQNIHPEIANSPFNMSYGKMMMWYFLISDTFTFGAFLASYACLRLANYDSWPDPTFVFKSVPLPGLDHYNLPLVFVSIMTFILILSSVTMVRAVQEGAMMNQKGVIKYLIPTVIGGILFLTCQYFEWTHLIHEGMTLTHTPFPGPDGKTVPLFGAFFFLITGFHGLHVFVGVLLNLYILFQTIKGTYQRLGNYEMVEKIGLYWHFVDLVWVYVFMAYYLM